MGAIGFKDVLVSGSKSSIQEAGFTFKCAQQNVKGAVKCQACAFTVVQCAKTVRLAYS